MKQLSPDPRLPQTDDISALKRRMYEIHRELVTTINQIIDKLNELESRLEALEP